MSTSEVTKLKILKEDGSTVELEAQDGLAVQVSETRSIFVFPLEGGAIGIFFVNEGYQDGGKQQQVVLHGDSALRLWQMLSILVAGDGLKNAKRPKFDAVTGTLS